MTYNRVIFCTSLIYSLILVLFSFSYEPYAISELIRNLAPTNKLEEITPINFSMIYTEVTKWAFVYSTAIILLSTAMTFASYSSLRVLFTAIARHWKPFFASTVAALIFPAMLQPPSSMGDPLIGTYFVVTLLHALFVAYFSVKLITMPMLQEKFGKEVDFPNNFSSRIMFWQISLSIMQTLPLYLSKEAYKIQLAFGIVSEVMHLIWLASFYELMVITVLVYYEKKMNLAEAARTSSIEKHGSSELLLDER